MPKLSKSSPISNTTKISELYGHGPLSRFEMRYVDTLHSIAEHVGIPKYQNQFVSNASFVGIEIEVENLKNGLFVNNTNPISTKSECVPYLPIFNEGIWKDEEDGSLRNYGHEYKTAPIRGENLYYALTIMGNLFRENPHADFSERTSVHVHIDARQFSIENILGFLLTYLSIEKILYKWLYTKSKKYNRYDNIFATPLESCVWKLPLQNLFDNYHDKKYDHVYISLEGWPKYTGLNFATLSKFGTIEFRQCFGTGDDLFLQKWINIILCIKKFARRYSLEEIKNILMNINTNSKYSLYLSDIFREFAEEFYIYDTHAAIESGVMLVKSIIHPYEETDKPVALSTVRNSLINDIFKKKEILLCDKSQYLDIESGKTPSNPW